MANTVLLSIGYFPNPTIGRPVSNGSIYVGVIDLDPKTPANQKQISVLQEDGTTVDVSQPISTSGGGIPLYNGSPVTILVEGSYSLRVDDKNDAQVYYVPKNALLSSVESLETIADLKAITETPADGDIFDVLGYYSATENRDWSFRWDSSDLSTEVAADTYSGVYVPLDSDSTGVGGAFVRRYSGSADAAWYGTKPDDLTFENTAIFDAVDENHREWHVGEGTFLTGLLWPRDNTTIRLSKNTIMRGTDNTYGAALTASIFIFDNRTNVTLIGENTRLEMTYADYTGESSHGIRIYNAANITVRDIYMYGSGGDGVSIGGNSALDPCNNILIEDCTFDNNRRNGGAYVHVQNSTVRNCRFLNNGGIVPEFGFDVEPNALSTMTNNVIENCLFSGNNDVGLGIVFAAKDLRVINCTSIGNGGENYLIGGASGVDNIKLTNCESSGSPISGMSVTLGTNIVIEDCNVHDNTGFGIFSTESTGLKIINTKSIDNTGVGIDVSGATSASVEISGGEVSGNTTFGINITNGDSHIVKNVDVKGNTLRGISVTGTEDVNIDSNDITGNGEQAIYHGTSTNTVIQNNVIRDNRDGILIAASSVQPQVDGNKLFNNGNSLTAAHAANIYITGATKPSIRDNISRQTDAIVGGVTLFGILTDETNTDGVAEGNDCFESGSTVGFYLGASMLNAGNRNFDGTWNTTAN